MPTHDDDSEKRRLLLAIITIAHPRFADWKKVAELMGEGYTEESVREQFEKIKVEVATESVESRARANDGGEDGNGNVGRSDEEVGESETTWAGEGEDSIETWLFPLLRSDLPGEHIDETLQAPSSAKHK